MLCGDLSDRLLSYASKVEVALAQNLQPVYREIDQRAGLKRRGNFALHTLHNAHSHKREGGCGSTTRTPHPETQRRQAELKASWD